MKSQWVSLITAVIGAFCLPFAIDFRRATFGKMLFKDVFRWGWKLQLVLLSCFLQFIFYSVFVPVVRSVP